MKTTRTRASLALFLLAALGSLLLSGCVSIPAGMYQNMLAYEPTPAPVKFKATVALQTIHKIDPAMEKVWRAWMNTDANMANYTSAFGTQIGRDIIGSGLFTDYKAEGPDVDLRLKITSTDTKIGNDYALQITYELTDAKTSQPINARTLTLTYGPKMTDARPKERLPVAMRQVKESIVADLQARISRQQAVAAEAQAKQLEQASLKDLLAGADSSVTLARGRNRAIIAAKTTQLPALLRESKSDELTALVVKIEQTILDLNHESEVAKDRAQQQLAAEAGAGASAEALRELAISYRERIELLKPIAAAVKEELANRSR